MIGLESASRPASEVLPIDRKEMIETAQTAAFHDDGFRILAQEADWKRDAGHWHEAESLYLKALKAQPYQRSYWGQVGHCARESGSLVRAEIAYRTACALGEPMAEIEPFIGVVLDAQGMSLADHPIFPYRAGAAPDEPPGWPDITLFARMAWQCDEVSEEEVLSLMRRHPTCDGLLAEMIGDNRFATAHHLWIAERRAGVTPTLTGSAARDGGVEIPSWASNLASIACPASAGFDPAKVADAIVVEQNAWQAIMAHDGFPAWPQTRAAVERVVETV